MAVFEEIERELAEGMGKDKCLPCGCMKGALYTLRAALRALDEPASESLAARIGPWLARTEPKRYDCLGCPHCYPAVATNLLHRAFPRLDASGPACDFELRADEWPPVPGEYFVLGEGEDFPIAVSTLASPALAEALAADPPPGVCIVGKTETENIGLDKLVTNAAASPHLRFLVVAGKEAEGHLSGATLLALAANGVDEQMRVVGAPGRRPVLRNAGRGAVDAFRERVRLVDLIGCEEPERVRAALADLRKAPAPVSIPQAACGCASCAPLSNGAAGDAPAPIVQAAAPPPEKIQLDPAGYFLILPRAEAGRLRVEHYAYDHRLLHVVEGEDPRSLCHTLTAGGWVSRLDHAAYLGRELERAARCLSEGARYVQDGA